MRKKIFDILPPKIAHKIENGIGFLSRDEKHYKNTGGAKNQNKGRYPTIEKHFPLKEVVAGLSVLFLILCGIFYFKLQKVNVEIWPKTEVLAFKEQVMADNSSTFVDLGTKTISAQYLTEEKDLWQEFTATGNASNDGFAEGKITIYNNYSPATAITLKNGTHFLSDSGKYFIILSRVVIPAAKKQNNKTVPGSITVDVRATDPGEEYNIKPAKFSVPKLVGTSYYYSIYAESSQEMKGGFSSEIKKVTENDITNAKDTLEKKILADIQDSLKNKMSEDYILIDDAILTEITESSSDVKAGVVMNKFNYQTKAKSTALVFKKSELESFVKGYIGSNISDSKTFLGDSLNIDYAPETVDVNNGKIVLNLDFSVKTYQKIDTNDLISLFREKSENNIKEVINSRMGDNVSQVKVNFWPFWTTKAPKDKSKTTIDLKFE